MTLSLLDLPIPDPLLYMGNQEPDWDLILVVSDALEDIGDLSMAQTLRWLFAWDHWPQYNPVRAWKWYIRHPSANGWGQCCRYVRTVNSDLADNPLLPTWRRAILPPDLQTPAVREAYQAHYFPTLSEALTAFSTWLPSPSYIPPLLPEFKNLYPRTLIPCT